MDKYILTCSLNDDCSTYIITNPILEDEVKPLTELTLSCRLRKVIPNIAATKHVLPILIENKIIPPLATFIDRGLTMFNVYFEPYEYED